MKKKKYYNKNKNVEPEKWNYNMNIHVPYNNMAAVAEGLKQSCANVPYYTSLSLEDEAYGIKLYITWFPQRRKTKTDLSRMSYIIIALFLHHEMIREWSYDEDPSTINYEAMQDCINYTVNKEIEEVRKSKEDLDNDEMKDWLNGRMFKVPAFPSQIVMENINKLKTVHS